MHDPREGPTPEAVTVAALFALPFAAYQALLHAFVPPTEGNWLRADPILTLWPRELSLWLPVVLTVLAALAWWRAARPGRGALAAGLREALLGVLLAALVVGVLRAIVGPSLPSFIPPEESAGPGYVLNMSAGLEEEAVCRLGVMPVCLWLLRPRLKPWVAAAISLVVTALFFSGWHALGEGAPTAQFFATRFLIPGCAMGVVWLASPSAIVSAHCAAHVLIPVVFIGASGPAGP